MYMSIQQGFSRLLLAAAALLALSLICAGPALAQFGSIRTSEEDDKTIRVNGEVDAYIEYISTNFKGDYSGDTRGDGAWSGAFGNGLADSYSNVQTRLREAEIHFRRTTTVSEGSEWRLHNEIELEFKPRTHDRDGQRFDLEEASATLFKNGGGMYFQIGFLEDKKLYEGGNTDETTSEDAKGFDENPSIRFGYYTGELDVDLRYASIIQRNDEVFEADLDGDSEADFTGRKDIVETQIRLQAEWKRKEFAEVLFSYTLVSSANKEDDRFQSSVAALEAANADTAAYEDAGLLSSTVIGLGGVMFFGDIWPSLTYESRHIEENKGDEGYDVSVIEAGVTVANLGPGNLWIAAELGNSDLSGEDVAFTQFSGEYHFKAGRSKYGPGFKSFSNDAPGEKLSGLIVYFGGEYVF